MFVDEAFKGSVADALVRGGGIDFVGSLRSGTAAITMTVALERAAPLRCPRVSAGGLRGERGVRLYGVDLGNCLAGEDSGERPIAETCAEKPGEPAVFAEER